MKIVLGLMTILLSNPDPIVVYCPASPSVGITATKLQAGYPVSLHLTFHKSRVCRKLLKDMKKPPKKKGVKSR